MIKPNKEIVISIIVTLYLILMFIPVVGILAAILALCMVSMYVMLYLLYNASPHLWKGVHNQDFIMSSWLPDIEKFMGGRKLNTTFIKYTDVISLMEITIQVGFQLIRQGI